MSSVPLHGAFGVLGFLVGILGVVSLVPMTGVLDPLGVPWCP